MFIAPFYLVVSVDCRARGLHREEGRGSTLCFVICTRRKKPVLALQPDLLTFVPRCGVGKQNPESVSETWRGGASSSSPLLGGVDAYPAKLNSQKVAVASPNDEYFFRPQVILLLLPRTHHLVSIAPLPGLLCNDTTGGRQPDLRRGGPQSPPSPGNPRTVPYLIVT